MDLVGRLMIPREFRLLAIRFLIRQPKTAEKRGRSFFFCGITS
jgi:hypothetical protein